MDKKHAGVDWAKEEHALCVVDETGRRLLERRFAHDERGLGELCRSLAGHGVQRVAIERPDGVLVERLLEAGLAVLPIHPNQMKAARPRFRAAGGKSDGFDAFVLAELARTDQHRFRALTPDSYETRALRALTRAREDLVEARVALANRLRAELEAFWPGAAVIFSEVDSPIALAFLERYPSPQDAHRLGEKRLSGFLSRHGYCGRKETTELLGRLRSAPEGRAGEAETEAHRTVVLSLVAALRPLVEQIKLLDSQIAHAVRAHTDGEIFLSLFRDPRASLTAARLVSEIGDRRERYPTSEALADDAGMCPVALESGKRRVATFRRDCDKRLRDGGGHPR
jgi:transposase